MTLAEIAEELRLLAGELKGHDEVDQWIRLDALADELVKEHRFIISRANALGRRVAAAEAERDRLREQFEEANVSATACRDERDRETELRRKAEKHNDELREVVASLPYPSDWTSLEGERDRLATQVEELEAALARAALDKETA